MKHGETERKKKSSNNSLFIYNAGHLRRSKKRIFNRKLRFSRLFPGSVCVCVCVSRLIICFSIFVCVNIVIFGLISKIVSCLKFPTAESKIQLHTVSRICVHFDLFSMWWIYDQRRRQQSHGWIGELSRSLSLFPCRSRQKDLWILTLEICETLLHRNAHFHHFEMHSTVS